MKQRLIHTVDLTRIQGDGDFQCPKCGTKISPDDKTDKVYCILETKLVDNDLEELAIQCLNCKSTIRITGFLAIGTVEM